MGKGFIPTRPGEDKSAIPAADKDLIAYAVAFGVPNEVAFLRFHPEYAGADGGLTAQGRKRSKDFWQYAKNKNFKEEYSKYLKDWILGKRGETDANVGAEVSEISEDKKRATITKMLNELVNLIGGGNLTGEDLKIYSEIMKKVGWLKDEVEEQVRPLRFLPQRCSSCRMRIFVESAVANGSVIDMCSFCKCRRFAEGNGYKFDEKDLLDIPQKIIEQIESKNDVTVADILSGKTEN